MSNLNLSEEPRRACEVAGMDLITASLFGVREITRMLDSKRTFHVTAGMDREGTGFCVFYGGPETVKQCSLECKVTTTIDADIDDTGVYVLARTMRDALDNQALSL